MKAKFVLAALVFVLCPLAAEEPWSVDKRHPTRISSTPPRAHRHHGWLGFYQEWISSFDGPRCQMHPTCSGYAAESFRKYGFWVGLLMTTDRLVHEADKMEFFDRRMVGPIPRFVDPPTDNYLWRDE